MIFDDQAFDSQNNVGHVLLHALDRRELMQRTAQFDLSDSATLKTGQQNPAEAVANGGAETPLKGLGRKFAVGISQRRGIGNNRTRKFEATPADMHQEVSFVASSNN
jgi:hypothetical protein